MKKFALLLAALVLVGCDGLTNNPIVQNIVDQSPNLAPINLEKPAEIEFMSPQNGAANVAGLTPITFLWQEPVLALQNHQAAKAFLEKNLTLSPTHSGEWRSLGTSGIMFEPKEAWPASTQFTLTPTPEILQDFIYQFETKRLGLDSTEDALLAGRNPLVLNFNQAVDLKALGNNLTVKSKNEERSIKLDIKYGETLDENQKPIVNQQQLELIPQGDWPENKTYTLSIAPGAYGLEGVLPIEAPIALDFTTQGPLKVVNQSVPQKHDQALSLDFSAPVSTKTLVENIIIEPAPATPLKEGALQYYYDSPYDTTSFYLRPPDGAWDPKTEYTINFKPAFKDTLGRSLTDFAPLTFQTNLASFFNPIYFPQNYSVFERNIGFKPTFSYGGNTERLEVSLNGNTKTYPLPSTEKERKIWELDLAQVFPEIYGINNEINPGDYRLRVEAFFREENRSSRYESRFFVSDFGVAIKQSANDKIEVEAVPYPGDRSLPMSVDMQFFVGDWQTEQSFRTVEGVSSLYEIEIPSDQFRLVRVTAGDKVGFGSPYFNQGMNVWDAQADYGAWKYSQNYSAALFTDRPLYKPGQTLFYKGFLRELELFGENFPLKEVTADTPDLNYEIVVFDPEYEEVDRFKGIVNQGSFDGRYTLPDGAKLGNYRLVFRIESGGDSFSTETPFWVEEYRKPNFLIGAGFSDTKAIAEETLTAEVSAEYAFGGAIVDRPVEYTVTLFGYEPCRFWCWGPQPRKDTVIARGESRLNEEGLLEIPLSLKNLELESIDWNLLTLNATVKVSDAEQSSTEISIPFYESDRRLEFEPLPNFLNAAETLTINGTVFDLASETVARQNVELKLMQTKWVRNQRQNADGNFYGEWESVSEEIESFETDSDRNGQFEFDFMAPSQGGEYSFEFTVEDSRNRTLTESKNFWVAGSDLSRTRQNNTNKILWLFPSQDRYQIGETAEVFAPNTDFTPTRVHATLERGEVLKTLIFNPDNNTVQFEVEDWMSPNVFVSILMEGEDADGNFKVKWGAHVIKVEDPSRALSVEVVPDKGVYRPGDEVQLQIKTQVNQSGVPAEVAIAVVDESLLALKARVPLDLMESLIGNWPLGVQTFHSLANYTSALEMNAIMEEVEAIADRMEMGFGGGGGKGDDEKPRGDFRDTATFIAKAQTDPNGVGRVNFTLPDNLTTWNIFVAGATKNNAFGTQTADFLVTLPLLVSEIVPNFLRAGDTVQMGLLIYRDDSEIESEKIKVRLNVPENLTVLGANEKTVEVGKEARVFFEVQVKPTTEAQTIDIGFDIEGQSSGLKDSVVLNRALRPTSQSLSAGEFQRVEERYNLKLLADPEAIASEFKVRIFASLASSLEALVELADQVNYGCTEQRLALLATQLYQRNLANALNQTTPPLDRTSLTATRDQIEQSFTGEGFAFWDQSSQPNFWVTTNVLEKASLLAEFDAPINPTQLATASGWLEKEVLKSCNKNLDWRCPHPISRVHAAAVLVNYNLIDINDLAFLSNFTDSLEAKVWWIKAAEKLETLPPNLVATKDTYLEAIIQAYNREDRYGFWTETDGAFYSQDERLTALVLEVLMETEQFENEYETIARYLSDSRKKQLSGNSAMRVLKALALYTQTQETDSIGANFTLENLTIDTVLLKGTLADLSQTQTYEKVDTFESEQNILLTTDKPVLADITLMDSLPAESIVANARGFWIERAVTEIGAEESISDIESLTLGQNYEVKLKVVTPKPYRQVLVEDPIPSGTEIVNFAFDNADQTLRTEPQNNCDWGWCQPLIQHQELREDKARFFIDYLPAGTHEITYILQPRLAGDYEWLPARVEAMYYPEISANTQGLRIEISAP